MLRFTDHARQRFLERSSKQFSHLQTCRDNNCDVCREMAYDLHELVTQRRREIDGPMREAIDKATEDRSFINNTEYMSRYYERYGYDERFRFLRGDNVIFVIVSKEEYDLVITCVPTKGHIVGRSHKKYRKVLA